MWPVESTAESIWSGSTAEMKEGLKEATQITEEEILLALSSHCILSIKFQMFQMFENLKHVYLQAKTCE